MDENFKQQFSWFFNKAKYSKEGWRIEKNIKNITSRLIDSKYSPGENVKTYLESNFLLMDKKAKSPIEPSCQPNTFVLNSCCTQNLLYLLFGHPLLFFNGSQKPLTLQKQKVTVELHYVVQEGYRVIFSTFKLKKNSSVTFDFQKNREHIFFVGKDDKVLLVQNACFQLHPLDLNVSQLQSATQGVSILDEDWSRFLKQWKKRYSDIEIKETDESQELIPEFTIANLMGWKFWLQLEKPISQKYEFLPKFQFSSKMQRNSYHKVGVSLENTVPYNSNELEAHNFKDLEQLLHYTLIKDSKKDQEYLLNSIVTSQFLQLARNYPYIYNSTHLQKRKKSILQLFKKSHSMQFHLHFFIASDRQTLIIKPFLKFVSNPKNRIFKIAYICFHNRLQFAY